MQGYEPIANTRTQKIDYGGEDTLNRKGGYYNRATEKQGGDVEGKLFNSVEKKNDIRRLLQLCFYISAINSSHKSRLRMYSDSEDDRSSH